MITTLTRWLIPDVPKKLMERIRHENFITNEVMIAQELRRAKGLTSIPEENLNSTFADENFTYSAGDTTNLSVRSGYDNPIIKEELVV